MRTVFNQLNQGLLPSTCETLAIEARVHGFEEQANRVDQIARDAKEPLLVMVVGEGKFGKSTLVNGLTGRDVAPVSLIPKTWKVDLYQGETGAGMHADLYWRSTPDAPQRVSIEEAVTTCAAQEAEAASRKGEGWKSDLFQVRWTRDLAWPPPHVTLVDTPGFSQLRADTEMTRRTLYGSEGIEVAAEDAFQYYYYRADLVLWCINATKLHDQDTLDALKAVADLDKTIVGVLTYMDRVPEERWNEVQVEAANVYGDYIEHFEFAAAGARGEVRVRTLDALRARLDQDFLARAPEVKAEAIALNVQSETDRFAEALDEVTSCYLSNLATLRSLRGRDWLDAPYKKAEADTKAVWKRARTKAVARIDSLWDAAGGDKRRFALLVSEQGMDIAAIQGEISRVINQLGSGVQAAAARLSREAKWEAVSVGALGSHRFRSEVSSLHIPQASGTIFSLVERERISVDDGEAVAGGIGLAVAGAFLLGPIGLAAGAIGYFVGKADADRRSKNSARGAIINACRRGEKEVASRIASTRSAFMRDANRALTTAFHKHHGRSETHVKRQVYAADLSINRLPSAPIGDGETVLPASLCPKGSSGVWWSWYRYKLAEGDPDEARIWDQAANAHWNHHMAPALLQKFKASRRMDLLRRQIEERADTAVQQVESVSRGGVIAIDNPQTVSTAIARAPHDLPNDAVQAISTTTEDGQTRMRSVRVHPFWVALASIPGEALAILPDVEALTVGTPDPHGAFALKYANGRAIRAVVKSRGVPSQRLRPKEIDKGVELSIGEDPGFSGLYLGGLAVVFLVMVGLILTLGDMLSGTAAFMLWIVLLLVIVGVIAVTITFVRRARLAHQERRRALVRNHFDRTLEQFMNVVAADAAAMVRAS